MFNKLEIKMRTNVGRIAVAAMAVCVIFGIGTMSRASDTPVLYPTTATSGASRAWNGSSNIPTLEADGRIKPVDSAYISGLESTQTVQIVAKSGDGTQKAFACTQGTAVTVSGVKYYPYTAAGLSTSAKLHAAIGYAPGTYTFTLQYKSMAGEWTNLGAALSISKPGPALYPATAPSGASRAWNGSYNIPTLEADGRIKPVDSAYIYGLSSEQEVQIIATSPSGATSAFACARGTTSATVSEKNYFPYTASGLTTAKLHTALGYDPGTYTFTLQYKNSAGTWVSIGSVLSATRPSPKVLPAASYSSAWGGTSSTPKILGDGQIDPPWCAYIYGLEANAQPVQVVVKAPSGATKAYALARDSACRDSGTERYYRYYSYYNIHTALGYDPGTYTFTLQYKSTAGTWVSIGSVLSATRPSPKVLPAASYSSAWGGTSSTPKILGDGQIDPPWCAYIYGLEANTQPVQVVVKAPSGATKAYAFAHDSAYRDSGTERYYRYYSYYNIHTALGYDPGTYTFTLQYKSTAGTWVSIGSVLSATRPSPKVLPAASSDLAWGGTSSKPKILEDGRITPPSSAYIYGLEANTQPVQVVVKAPSGATKAYAFALNSVFNEYSGTERYCLYSLHGYNIHTDLGYDPGTYTFTLQYKNIAGVWTNIGSILTIKKPTPQADTTAASLPSITTNAATGVISVKANAYVYSYHGYDYRFLVTAPDGKENSIAATLVSSNTKTVSSKKYYKYTATISNVHTFTGSYATGTYSLVLQCRKEGSSGAWSNLITPVTADKPVHLLYADKKPAFTGRLSLNTDAYVYASDCYEYQYKITPSIGASVVKPATRDAGTYKTDSSNRRYYHVSASTLDVFSITGCDNAGTYRAYLQYREKGSSQSWKNLYSLSTYVEAFGRFKVTETSTKFTLDFEAGGYATSYSDVYSEGSGYVKQEKTDLLHVNIWSAKDGKDDLKTYTRSAGQITITRDDLCTFYAWSADTSSTGSHTAVMPKLCRLVVNKADHNNDEGLYYAEIVNNVYSSYQARFTSWITNTPTTYGTMAFYIGAVETQVAPCPTILFNGATPTNMTQTTEANGDVKTKIILTTNGTLNLSADTIATITLIGGGGGGGAATGGGGGSGCVFKQTVPLAAGNHAVRIGAGGKGNATKSVKGGYSSETYETWGDGWTGVQVEAGANGGGTQVGPYAIPGGGGGACFGEGDPYKDYYWDLGAKNYGGFGHEKATTTGGNAGVFGSYGKGGNTGTTTAYTPASETSPAENSAASGVAIIEITSRSYTVEFDRNEGTAGTMESQRLAMGMATPLRANTFTKTGTIEYDLGEAGGSQTPTTVNYVFAGWATTPTGAVEYTDKHAVRDLTTTPNGTVTLYAKFNAPAVPLVIPVNENYDFLGWYKDAELTQQVSGSGGVSLDGVGSATYTPESENETLHAKWKPKTRTLTVTETEHGTVNPMSIQAEHGSSATFTVTPEYGYEIDRIVINGVTNPSYITDLQAGTYTIPSVTADGTIQVVYKLKTYTLTVTYDTGADVSPHTMEVQHGSTVTFTISSILGYEIEDVKFNGVSQGALATYTTPALTGDSTLHVSVQSLWDFEILTLVPGNARVGTPMFFAAKLSNDGVAHDAVPATLKIGSTTLTATTAVGERGETMIYFDWTPTEEGTFTVTAEVNPTHSIEEADYTNNVFTGTIDVLPAYDAALPTDPNAGRLAPNADGMLTTPPVPTGMNERYITWEENGTTYWARLNFSADIEEPSLDPMRSGYGFTVTATATITHNYYNDERIREPEGIFMLLPEYGFAYGVAMEKQADGTWILPINPTSPQGARRWYIPVNYADGEEYKVMFQAYGAYTPAGELTATEIKDRTIQGSMYDDDITTATP